VVGRQPYAQAAFTPGELAGTHFQGLSRPQGAWFHRGGVTKKIDPGTVRLVAQCLNQYATSGTHYNIYHCVKIAYSIQYSNMQYRFVASKQ